MKIPPKGMMMKSYSAEQLRAYAGTMKQLAGVRRCVLDDGRARGIRAAEIYNGSGLQYTVLIDRGMDIGYASFKGLSLTYLAPGGFGHPAYAETAGFGWLRNWGVGLLTGCGLTHAGMPEAADGFAVDGPHGLHGRISNIPAEDIAVAEAWEGDRYVVGIAGTVMQSGVFAEILELRRTIATALGENVITVRDRVTNRAHRPSPLMALYHINLGFPLVCGSSRIVAREHEVVPRPGNAGAARDIAGWAQCLPPAPDYAEQVFYHDVPADADGMMRMTLENPDAGLSLCVAARKAELPRFIQWKMMGQDEYVLGLEPANCYPEGQAWERENGDLRMIGPGETVEFLLSLAVGEA